MDTVNTLYQMLTFQKSIKIDFFLNNTHTLQILLNLKSFFLNV